MRDRWIDRPELSLRFPRSPLDIAQNLGQLLTSFIRSECPEILARFTNGERYTWLRIVIDLHLVAYVYVADVERGHTNGVGPALAILPVDHGPFSDVAKRERLETSTTFLPM